MVKRGRSFLPKGGHSATFTEVNNNTHKVDSTETYINMSNSTNRRPERLVINNWGAFIDFTADPHTQILRCLNMFS